MTKAFNQGIVTSSRSIIDRSERFVITAHKSPDGDAVGSSLALFHYLKKRGKLVDVVLPDHFAEFLEWMPGTDQIVFFDTDSAQAKEKLASADVIFCLDYNDLSRTGALRPMLEQYVETKTFILIDHHQHPDSFPEVLISDTSSCSTAQLIYRFIEHLGDRELIDAQIGACIYCGIMTDSGSFRFPSVDPETHTIAADLIQRGVDHAEIHRNVYDTNLLDRLRLVGFALSEKLVVIDELHTAYISLSAEELLRFNYRPGDTEGLVNQALSIKGVNFAAFIREGSSEVKLSLRSKGAFRVNEVAHEHFNGGGHHNAAGGAMEASLDEVVAKFKSILPAYREQLNYMV